MILIWQPQPPYIPTLQQLASSDSLTQALSSLAHLSVQVQQLGETTHYPYFTDFRLPEKPFSRQVILKLNNTPVVHAQSICAPHSQWRNILNCGQTPLGNILFSGSLKGLQRSALQYTQPNHYLLARRSWFDYQGERLYLVECFLPEILHFQAA